MNLRFCFALSAVLVLFVACSNSGNKSEISKEAKGKGGYLFAHMLKSDYGSLYYSISHDGLHWELLNKGERIDSSYRGHPDICKGRDGQYYMIGVEGSTGIPILWRSDNLVTWRKQKHLSKSVFQDNNPGVIANQGWLGAPKMFYDKTSRNYIITWHASKAGINRGDELWKSMRTFYILSSDFEKFTHPRRLFEFEGDADREMATIDVIIQKVGDIYYAIIKDERWPVDCKTGKTIRVSTSKNLIGPYCNPGPPITPTWFEAPSLVSKSDNSGWYLYAESYPNKYMLFEADSLIGSWSPINLNLENIRHGCVIQINENQFNNIKSTFAF